MRLERLRWIVSIASGVCLFANGACVQAAAAGQAAQWMTHDLIVRLDDLPTRYSCNDLWTKFHDVLLALGARPGTMKIAAYRCESSLGREALSPDVHLVFQTPEALGHAQSRWSDVEAVTKTVRLEPGTPLSLDNSDCELLRQIKDTLLAELSDKTLNYRLACHAPPTGDPQFSLAVEALTPATGMPVRVASVAEPQSPRRNP